MGVTHSQNILYACIKFLKVCLGLKYCKTDNSDICRVCFHMALLQGQPTGEGRGYNTGALRREVYMPPHFHMWVCAKWVSLPSFLEIRGLSAHKPSHFADVGFLSVCHDYHWLVKKLS